MKRAFLQLFEHKSREEQTEVVINEATIKALEQMINILSKSLDPKLTGQKKKITLVKEKAEKIILKKQQKEKEIQTITEKIQQQTALSETLSSVMERYPKQKKKISALDIDLQKLKKPEPLEPCEMIDVLLYSSDTDSELSVTDILQMLDKLSGETPRHNLIYISDNLVNTVLKNHITREITLRKTFLDQTKKDLLMVTKLPKKPGDPENISGVVKNLQESFKNVFAHNQELYKNQIDLLAESLHLLLLIRGKLKIWPDVDKFVKQNNITDGSLVTIINKAKSGKGGGILGFLGGPELELLSNLVDKVEFLTRDYWWFYNAFFDESSNSYLLSKINAFRKILIKQLDAGFESFIKDKASNNNKSTSTNTFKLVNVKESSFQTLKQTKTLIQIINSVIGEQESLMVLEYLGVTAARLNNHYHTQLVCTNLAIKQLLTIKASFKQTKIYTDKSEIDSLYPAYFLDIDNYFKNIKITNIIVEYIDIKNSAEKEYLGILVKYNIEKKLLFLKSTQQVFNFYEDVFADIDHLRDFKDSLAVLDLMEIDLGSSEFFKITDVRNQFNLDFIRSIIYHLIVDIFKFFSFEDIKSLDSLKTEPIQQKIKKIEYYLVKKTGPMIEDLVKSAISSESELLDNFSYLITPKNSLTSSKGTNPLKLLNLVISLSEYGEFSPEKLLTKESIYKIITLNQDKIVKGIKEIDYTSQYWKHKGGPHFNYGTKAPIIFNLIDLGCINIEIMDELLKIGIDPNNTYKGRTLLDSIAYQLTKVVREPDFYNLPRCQKYIVDPEKQDQLIDVALHLIQNNADINSSRHKNGFLTTLFSLIPSGQNPYLYKKLLSHQKVISNLDLQEVDLWGRNLAHLFCKDLLEIFYSFPDAEAAKVQVNNILTSIISSKKSDHFNKQDKEGNTPWHYLASSITADYVKPKTDCPFSKFKDRIDLSTQNIYCDTPLHTAFTMLGDPAAFYEFVLTDIYPPTQWLKCPKLGLKIKNKQEQTVLDMVISTKNKLAASIINTYMAVINYKIDLDDDCTFETARSKVDTFLKAVQDVPPYEIERTKYLGEKYDSTRYDSNSSGSSLSSSSSSSMPHLFSSSSTSHLAIELNMEKIETEVSGLKHDWSPPGTPLGDCTDLTFTEI